MGAVPKNKITSAERGKRRQGNRPSLKKNLAYAEVPLHKKGLVAQIFHTIGLKSPVGAKLAKKRKTVQDKKEKQSTKKKKQAPQKKAKKPTPKTKTETTSEVKPSKQRQAQVKANKPSKQRAQDRG